jgi:hypothetical protein
MKRAYNLLYALVVLEFNVILFYLICYRFPALPFQQSLLCLDLNAFLSFHKIYSIHVIKSAHNLTDKYDGQSFTTTTFCTFSCLNSESENLIRQFL